MIKAQKIMRRVRTFLWMLFKPPILVKSIKELTKCIKRKKCFIYAYSIIVKCEDRYYFYSKESTEYKKYFPLTVCSHIDLSLETRSYLLKGIFNKLFGNLRIKKTQVILRPMNMSPFLNTAFYMTVFELEEESNLDVYDIYPVTFNNMNLHSDSNLFFNQLLR